MSPDLTILVDSKVSPSLIKNIDQLLLEVFSFNNIVLVESILLPHSCWDKSRHQYNASCLLSFAKSKASNEIAALIIATDAYVPGLNFVFGVAARDQGIVVSTFRLENDPEFLLKEITHELGHIFGLTHCSLPCVMTFSNSVWEARMKSNIFCEKCWDKISQEKY
ncbi:MAG: archemetzincin [Candidatus Heimdallarchaeota archaeon]|nr:MAG: archemetzincin [Candidatus Heimdallarchaeota archaeon]